MSGLVNAPVTKGLLIACTGASILAQAARTSRRRTPIVIQLASRFLVLRSPGELVFGVFLLYYFRVLERQNGSSKFGAFAAVVTGISAVLQYSLQRVLKLEHGAAPGPYGFIFACLVQFVFTVPAYSKFTIGGWRFSDKVFTYLAGLQLLVMGGRSSLLAGAAGVLAGCLYRANVFGLKRLRVPTALTNFLARVFGQPLREPRQQHQAHGSTSDARGRTGAGHPRTRHAAGTQEPQRQQQQQQQMVPEPAEAALRGLMEMGFDQAQAAMALQATNNDVDMAISLLVG